MGWATLSKCHRETWKQWHFMTEQCVFIWGKLLLPLLLLLLDRFQNLLFWTLFIRRRKRRLYWDEQHIFGWFLLFKLAFEWNTSLFVWHTTKVRSFFKDGKQTAGCTNFCTETRLRRPVSVRNSEHPAICLPSLKREQTLVSITVHKISYHQYTVQCAKQN